MYPKTYKSVRDRGVEGNLRDSIIEQGGLEVVKNTKPLNPETTSEEQNRPHICGKDRYGPLWTESFVVVYVNQEEGTIF